MTASLLLVVVISQGFNIPRNSRDKLVKITITSTFDEELLPNENVFLPVVHEENVKDVHEFLVTQNAHKGLRDPLSHP